MFEVQVDEGSQEVLVRENVSRTLYKMSALFPLQIPNCVRI